jgi:hypothetical protein
MDLLGNTFLGEGRHNFEIRGEPCHYVYVRRNISLQSEGDTINPGPALIITQSEPEQFDRPNPTTELGVGDFDGDGVDDLLLATGTTWYYSAQGVAEWRLINDNPDLVPTLRFGDFDGDGRTDVLGKNGRNLVASWGGVSEWETVNEIDAPLADLVVGQFDDDPIADIFYADGESWYISYDNGPFAFVNTSGFRVPSLRFGDFDGDGRTDVFGVGPREWRVSYAATTPWTPLRSRLTRSVDGLVVADFDGNGRADVALPFSSFVHIWGVSRDGLTDWRGLAQPTTYPLVAAGHVLAGDPRASLLLWGGNHFYRATFGESRVVRHSSQEMR